MYRGRIQPAFKQRLAGCGEGRGRRRSWVGHGGRPAPPSGRCASSAARTSVSPSGYATMCARSHCAWPLPPPPVVSACPPAHPQARTRHGMFGCRPTTRALWMRVCADPWNYNCKHVSRSPSIPVKARGRPVEGTAAGGACGRVGGHCGAGGAGGRGGGGAGGHAIRRHSRPPPCGRRDPRERRPRRSRAALAAHARCLAACLKRLA